MILRSPLRVFLHLITVVVVSFSSSSTTSSEVRFDNAIVSLGQAVRQLGGINDIEQDGHGFIWLGGESGLARYDGTELRLYQAQGDEASGLPSNYVWDLEVDDYGALWIGTSGGLVKYQPDTDDFTLMDSFNGRPLSSAVITSLSAYKQQLYIGSAFGVDLVDLNTANTLSVTSGIHGHPQDSNTINDIEVDPRGNVWLATKLGGLARLDVANRELDYVLQNHKPQPNQALNIGAVVLDAQERLWLGTHGHGIVIYSPETGELQPVTYPAHLGNPATSTVMDIMEDAHGDVWVSIDQVGLLRFKPDLSLAEHYSHSSSDSHSLLSNQPRTLFQDVNMDLWVGIFPFGVSFWDRSREAIRTYRTDSADPSTLSNNATLSILESRDGTIWIGTEGGLNALDPNAGGITRFLADPGDANALAANAVLALDEDQQGNIWIGTWSGGLHRFTPSTGKFQRYGPDGTPRGLSDPYVWTLLVDSDNTLWVGSETGGLQRFQRETGDFIRYQHDPADPHSISGNYLLDIVEDREGRLWIATFAGLNMFDKATEKFTVYTPKPEDPHSLATSSIKSLYADSRGYIWVGGGEKGVGRLDPRTGKVVRIDVPDGLPSGTISSIQEDCEGYIWLATNRGLARLHPNTLAVTVVGVEHGLAGANHNRDAATRSNECTLYFGSTEGVTAFRPEDIVVNESIHPIHLTAFRVLNADVPFGTPDAPLDRNIVTADAVLLDYTDSMFSFDFVMLNYRNAHQNQYAYKLDGFDMAWNDVGHLQTATYTNMDPGKYLFRVRAKAPGEQWQERGKALEVYIAPPPWRTWWAYCLYGLLVVASFYIVYALGRFKRTYNNYRVLSLTDPLTGAYNRAGIRQIVQGLFANEAIKDGVCAMLLDIDHFKRINDTHGHEVGDHVLTSITNVVTTTIRQGDYLGRWGGEEFVLLCARSTEEGAHCLAEKLRKAVEAHTFTCGEASPIEKVTVSIGFCLVQPGETFEQALHRADMALYRAKGGGRNQTVFAQADSWSNS